MQHVAKAQDDPASSVLSEVRLKFLVLLGVFQRMLLLTGTSFTGNLIVSNKIYSVKPGVDIVQVMM